MLIHDTSVARINYNRSRESATSHESSHRHFFAIKIYSLSINIARCRVLARPTYRSMQLSKDNYGQLCKRHRGEFAGLCNVEINSRQIILTNYDSVLTVCPGKSTKIANLHASTGFDCHKGLWWRSSKELKMYHKTETTNIITNGVTRLNNSLVLSVQVSFPGVW